LDDDDDLDRDDERSRMLHTQSISQERHSLDDGENFFRDSDNDVDEVEGQHHGRKGKGKAKVIDTSGRSVPPSEWAPLPRGL
jgi:hypothetical protein